MDEAAKMREELSNKFQEELRGCWAILTSGPRVYLGRIIEGRNERRETTRSFLPIGAEEQPAISLKEQILHILPGVLAISPYFELIVQLRQTPQGALQKDPLVLPPGMLSQVSKRYLMNPEIEFFSDMSETDQADHRNMVLMGLHSLSTTRKADSPASEPLIASPHSRAAAEVLGGLGRSRR